MPVLWVLHISVLDVIDWWKEGQGYVCSHDEQHDRIADIIPLLRGLVKSPDIDLNALTILVHVDDDRL